MFDEKIKELKASINSLSITIADKTAQVKNALEADDLEKARTIKNEIDTVKDSTFDCIQENIEELYILLKKESSGQKRIAPSSILQSILLNLVDGDYL